MWCFHTYTLIHVYESIHVKKWWTRCDIFHICKYIYEMWWTRRDSFHMKFHIWNNPCFWSVFHEENHIYKISHIFHNFFMYKKCHVWSIASNWGNNISHIERILGLRLFNVIYLIYIFANWERVEWWKAMSWLWVSDLGQK